MLRPAVKRSVSDRPDFGLNERTKIMSMTSGTRIEKAFRHEEPDRTPSFEYVLLSPIADLALGGKFYDFIER